MQVKFETKSARVKGLSFHPNRPWILASLHSGEIQLWDYRIGTLIEKFVEHEGPVRGIAFHPTQPIFASGGDDTKIIGWNYRTKSKAFLLKGHLDFIRTVSFHNQLPWLLSASDDYTCKIWNYVSRTCIYTMSGHANLVMCAQFHPRNDLIISCSLDFTLRLWDFTNLRKKYTTADAREKQLEAGISGHEVEVKAIIDAHDRGVNWCAFHPTGNLIASVGDDNKVRLWKFSEGTGKITEYDVLYGHNKNVSCVLFHERLDVIITNSEDKTVRVWDLYKKTCIDTFTKDNGKHWVLASHPQINYVATGHDNGFSVFTLQSERISAVLAPSLQDVFYVYKKQLFHKDCRNGKETLIKDIDHTSTGSSMSYQQPTAIYYNQWNNASNNVLIQFKDKEKIYHKYYLYTFDSNIARAKHECSSTFRYCLGAVFVGKDKLAILSNAREVGLLDNSGNIKNLPNLPLVDMIYPANMGKIIMRSETSAILYDTTTRKLINQIDYTDIQHLKRVVWSNKYTHVALLCRRTVYILNKNFNLLTSINEQFKVSSAVWNTDGVLIYTTKTHLKYALVNGDQGIIKSLETPIYLIQANGNEIIAIDPEARFQKFSIDREEYLFKLAIRSRNAAKIDACLKNYTKLGNSLISYLYKKNYSAIALHMVDDLRARFSLAIDSGNLEVAFETCHDQLKDKESYAILSEEALRQGNHQIMEIAYQKNRNYEKLSFLYLATGNYQKLEKMLGIAQKRGDVMSRFQNALFLGDIKERVRLLAEAGLVHLAYLTAVNHGLEDMVAPLAQALEGNLPSINVSEKPTALIPPKPLVLNVQASPIATVNWPHKELNEEEILLAGVNEEEETQETAPQELELNIDSEFNDNKNAPKDFGLEKDIMSPLEEGNWGVDDIVDLPDIDEIDVNSANQQISSLADSAPGRDPLVEKARNSQLAGELVACGDFEGAAGILKRQIGVRDAAAFAPVFKKVFNSSRVQISGLPFVNPVGIHLSSEDGKRLQVLGSTSQLMNILRVGYRQTSDGKFAEALSSFRDILLQIPLLVLQNPQEEQDIYTLINICYNYIMALRCEISRRQNQDNPKRSLELSAYMCCCAMEPAHRVLVLRNAMALAYKQQDFIYAAYFAKRVLQIAETNPNVIKADKLDNARKVYAACEQKGTNQNTIEFDQNWLYENDAVTKICAKSLTPIKGSQVKRDAFVKASYKSEYEGQIDDIAGVCVIGAECLGLKLC